MIPRAASRVGAASAALVAAIVAYACGDGLTVPGVDRAPSEVTPPIQGAVHVADLPIKTCGETTTVDLVGNGEVVLGRVTVSNDDDEVTVVFETAGAWELATTHVAVNASPADIPVSPAGLPEIGLFPWGDDHPLGTTVFSVTVRMDELGVGVDDELVVAAHADVIDRNDPADPEDDRIEGGWGDGTPFTRRPRGNVGRYFMHTVQACTQVTQTVGADGGTILVEGRTPDEGATLVIPAGALEEPVEITIRALPLSEIVLPDGAELELGDLVEGTAYDFTPDGLHFLAPALLTIGYDENLVEPPESELVIFRVDGAVGTLDGTSVDEVANELSASIEHFTVYVAGTDEGLEMTVIEGIGVTDDVTIEVRSPVRPELAEAIGVTDDVTINVRSPVRPEVAEAIGVSDEVTINVRSPFRLDVAEPIGVTDEVTINVAPAPLGDFIYVALQGADSVAVIDRATNTLVTRIPVGRFPYAVAVRPDGSEVWVTNRGDASVSVIDVATQAVVETIPDLAFIVGDPIDIAFTPDGTMAYVVDNDGPIVAGIGAETRAILVEMVGATRTARSIALTDQMGYVAGVDSLVTFSLGSGEAVDTITGGFSTGEVVLTPDEAELWLTDFADDEILVFDVAGPALLTTVPGVTAPQGIAIADAGLTAWVADGASSITPIALATRTLGAGIALAFEPDWLAVSSDGTRAYASEGPQGTQLAVVDLTTGSVVVTLPIGSSPAQVAVTW